MAKDKSATGPTVLFRFTSHCFIEEFQGAMGDVKEFPADIVAKYADRGIGVVIDTPAKDSSDAEPA